MSAIGDTTLPQFTPEVERKVPEDTPYAFVDDATKQSTHSQYVRKPVSFFLGINADPFVVKAIQAQFNAPRHVYGSKMLLLNFERSYDRDCVAAAINSQDYYNALTKHIDTIQDIITFNIQTYSIDMPIKADPHFA